MTDYKEDALNDYSNWLKKQTTNFNYNYCEVLAYRYYFANRFITKMLYDLRDWRKI